MIRLTNKFSNAEIIRSRDPKVILPYLYIPFLDCFQTLVFPSAETELDLMLFAAVYYEQLPQWA